MITRVALAFAAVVMSNPVSAAPATTAYIYCTAQSTNPRGQGLIVTAVFRSRSETAFVESAFINFLRTSYAPYGNGWVFRERAVSCLSFAERRKAEIQRSLDISRVPQPIQSVFPVTFQIG